MCHLAACCICALASHPCSALALVLLCQCPMQLSMALRFSVPHCATAAQPRKADAIPLHKFQTVELPSSPRTLLHVWS